MDPLQPNSKIIFCHHGTKTPNKKRNSDLQNKRNQPFLKMMQSQFFFSCPTSQLHGVPSRLPNLHQLQLTLRANEQRFYLYAHCSVFLRHNSYLTLPYVRSLRGSFCLGTSAHVFARKQRILFFKGRYDHRSSNCNFKQLQINPKKIPGHQLDSNPKPVRQRCSANAPIEP